MMTADAPNPGAPSPDPGPRTPQRTPPPPFAGTPGARLVKALIDKVPGEETRDRVALVARECATSPRSVYRWSSGEHAPMRVYARTLLRLAREHGVDGTTIDAFDTAARVA